VSSSPPPDDHPALRAVLEDARALGFLGPGPIDPHIANAEAFGRVGREPARGLDLGSGAGLPGLVLAIRWPASSWVLLDAMQKRCAFLADAVVALGLDRRVSVRCERAEVAGRDPQLRGRCDLVVARGFAAPPVTAECGAPFLRVGGELLVSEPPDDRGRWSGVGALGLDDRGVTEAEGTHLRRLVQTTPCGERFPRRVGVPQKRPLW
jgi:16S rRNA (guanine527-N7)-methyltransferase